MDASNETILRMRVEMGALRETGARLETERNAVQNAYAALKDDAAWQKREAERQIADLTQKLQVALLQVDGVQKRIDEALRQNDCFNEGEHHIARSRMVKALTEKRKDEPPKPWTKEHCQREAHCGYPFEATCGCRCAKCV